MNTEPTARQRVPGSFPSLRGGNGREHDRDAHDGYQNHCCAGESKQRAAQPTRRLTRPRLALTGSYRGNFLGHSRESVSPLIHERRGDPPQQVPRGGSYGSRKDGRDRQTARCEQPLMGRPAG